MEVCISNYYYILILIVMKIVKNTDNTILKEKSEITDAQAEEAFRTILSWIGENPNREGLRETPRRVIKAFKEISKDISRK